MPGRFLRRIRYNLVWIQIRFLTIPNKKPVQVQKEQEKAAPVAPQTIRPIIRVPTCYLKKNVSNLNINL